MMENVPHNRGVLTIGNATGGGFSSDRVSLGDR